MKTIINNWLEYNNDNEESLIIREINDGYEMSINNRTIFIPILKTSTLEEMEYYIKKAIEYNNFWNEFYSKNIEKKIFEKDGLDYIFNKGYKHSYIEIKKGKKSIGKKEGNICSFENFLCLEGFYFHGTAFIDKEYRGQGYAKIMYDLFKDLQLPMVPHGFPLETNLIEDGRNFWNKKENLEGEILYNNDEYKKLKDMLYFRNELLYGNIKIYFIDEIRYEEQSRILLLEVENLPEEHREEYIKNVKCENLYISEQVKFILIAKQYQKDISIYQNENEICYSVFPEFMNTNNKKLIKTLSIEDYMNELSDKYMLTTDDWEDAIYNLQQDKKFKKNVLIEDWDILSYLSTSKDKQLCM